MAFVPFQATVNLNEISTRNDPAQIGGRVETPVAGCYPVVVLDAGISVKEGEDVETAKSLGFYVEVTTGEYSGFRTWINTGRDMTKTGNRIFWKTALVSMGYDEGSLDGEVNIDTASYIGLNAFMRFIPKSPNPTTKAEQYDAREFVTPAYYENWKASQGAVAAPVTTTFKTSTAVASAPKAAPTAGAPARAAAVPQPAAGAANKYAGLIAK